MACRILIVDDDEIARDGVREALQGNTYVVETAGNVAQAKERLETFAPDIVITDLRMPNKEEGMDLLAYIKKDPRFDIAVIMMTAYGDIGTAVHAMQLGATDYFGKPYTKNEITARVDKAVKDLEQARANAGLRKQIAAEHEIVGSSSAINRLKERIKPVAPTNASVLITGPNGCGKDLVAWAIQQGSLRVGKPFVLVNCAGMADSLIEAELFGAEKGAYTGADVKKIGCFQQADKGTIFLDEIGDMSEKAQTKVLRLIEKGEISPVGGEGKIMQVDVRVIAATNKDLPAMIKDGRFRMDLYHRLTTVVIEVPSLAQRREDIPELVTHFLRKMGKNATAKQMFTPHALEYLQSWSWPGNVRELRNVIERALIFNDGSVIDRDKIEILNGPTSSRTVPVLDTSRPLREARAAWERAYIAQVLAEVKSVTKAAERLGLQRGSLHEKMNELRITRKPEATEEF